MNNNTIITSSAIAAPTNEKLFGGEMSADDDEDHIIRTHTTETIRSMNRNWIDKSIETHLCAR